MVARSSWLPPEGRGRYGGDGNGGGSTAVEYAGGAAGDIGIEGVDGGATSGGE